MNGKVLTLEMLKSMAGEIADLLLQRTGASRQQVELQISASRGDGGVRVQIEATSANGQALFAIQVEVFGAWLEDATELNLRSVVYNS